MAQASYDSTRTGTRKIAGASKVECMASGNRSAGTAELSPNLDNWPVDDNTARTPQGKRCCGWTPLEMLVDGKKLWQDKKLHCT